MKMKRLDFIKKCAAVLVIIVAASFIIDTGCNLGAEESVINFTGVIVKTIGEVKIRKSGEKTWVDAKHGMELGIEDQIMTGADSTMDIIFKRNGQRSHIRILEKADMILMTLNLDKVTGDSEILLDLAIGHIIIKTDPLKGKSRFEVLTPTSMTAVRGTVFEVNVIKEEEGPLSNADISQ